MAFNSSLAAALASRKKFVDATSSITSVGEGTKARDKPGTEFYSGNFVEKSSTGFTGLANQGATCYLNSFIQSLYMTPEFRRAVYQYVWDKDEPADTCIGLQLQKLFARLQISDKGAVTTSGLTKSFGWDSADVFTQQDVQEMFHVLFEAIEKTCAGSELGSIVTSSYRGVNTDFVHCQTCQNFRGREDTYLDLGLTVEGTGSLNAALDAFVKTEILADKNAYNCAPCKSKQPAEKGLRFSSFPYILSLQLQRFKMNWQFMRREKVNDEFYFPPTIDLAKWLPADKSGPAEGLNYELYAILIHTGGASAGHYFSYIKNFSDKKWYRFDDAAVTPLDQKDVDSMFFDEEAKRKQDAEEAAARALAAAAATPATSDTGGISDAPPDAPAPPPPPPPPTEKKVTFGTGSVLAGELRPKGRGGAPVVFIDPKKNAYMLIYRRVDASRNLLTVDSKEIPTAMQEEVKAENSVYAVQKKEYDRQRALTRIDFYWNNVKTRIEFNKEETSIAAATERAWRELKIGDGENAVPLDRIRLRNYDTLKNTPGMPYAAPYIDPSTLISLLDFADNKPLIIETRAADGEWPIWRPNQTAFQVVLLDSKTNEYRVAVTVEAAEAGNIKELRLAVATALSIPVANTQLVFLGGDTPKVFSDDFKTIKELRLVRGDTIHAEVVESLTASPVVSRVIEKYELAVNCVPMRFNIPRNVVWTDEIKSLRAITETRVSQRYAAKLAADEEEEARRRRDGDSSESRMGGGMVMARLEQKRLKFSNDGALPDNMIEVELDIRRPLIDLKREISRIIGIPLDKFKLRNAPAGNELKDLSRGIVQYGLDGSLWVEEGIPLVEGQYVFKVYLEVPYEAKAEEKHGATDAAAAPSPPVSLPATDSASSIPLPPPGDVPDLSSTAPPPPPPPDAPSAPGISAPETKATEVKHTDLVFLQDVILEAKWSLKRVKEELAKLDRAPPVELMRVRERSAPPSTTLTAFYVDSKVLDQNAKGIRDGKLLVIQRTVVPETLTEDHVLVYVRQWHPVEFQLAAPQEMAFLRSLTHVELKKQLASIAGIKKAEDVAIVKPMAWKLADLDNLPGLDWHEPSITKTSSLGGTPWRLGTGTQAVIVYKDKTLPERVIIPEELHDTSVKSTHRERGVKILSRAEIKERDEQKAKEAELLKKAEEEAREERLAQQRAAGAGIIASTTSASTPATAATAVTTPATSAPSPP